MPRVRISKQQQRIAEKLRERAEKRDAGPVIVEGPLAGLPARFRPQAVRTDADVNAAYQRGYEDGVAAHSKAGRAVKKAKTKKGNRR